MHAQRCIAVILMFASITCLSAATQPEIEIIGSISREDVREISRVVRKHTREPITRITCYDAQGNETASSHKPVVGVSVQTGDPLKQVTGGSFYLEKHRGGWSISRLSHWIR